MGHSFCYTPLYIKNGSKDRPEKVRNLLPHCVSIKKETDPSTNGMRIEKMPSK